VKARYPICVKRHLEASEERVVERFGAWHGMLETTSLNKSYKMVVLRVLLDRAALWDGLEIPRLAAACRSFLENHPTLRADLPEIRSQNSYGSERTDFSPLTRHLEHDRQRPTVTPPLCQYVTSSTMGGLDRNTEPDIRPNSYPQIGCSR
jgi:hypothetical protein